ncbi:M15 family metallopeptidase [Deinococcus multiflagellatus]|uniref:M15 family metallopeptidase n=1 Tax=Deinococcus multiflagellatus TaxID=1656887 RepID=A0ABW1ZG72_9DEIO
MVYPSPAWQQAHLVKVPLTALPGWPPYPGAEVSGVTVHQLVAGPLVATWVELRRRGLVDKLRTYNGAFAPRHMGHDRNRPLSVHAFGAALDFDAAWNGYGVPLDRMQINRDVVRTFEECGWHWGGRWADPYEDGMHFQWTDPLPGVPLPEWQDAMARQASAAPTPPPAAPTPSEPLGIVELLDRAGNLVTTPYTHATYHGVRFVRLPGGRVRLLPPEGSA